MGKWLTIEEKLNAENEFKENRLRIKQLRVEIQNLQYRNKKLSRFLVYSKRSKYKGLYGINGNCYKIYGKKYKELNEEELKEYNKLKKVQSRQRLGRN